MPAATVEVPATRDESATVNKLRELYLIARNSKRARYDTWIRNYRLVNNRFGGGQSSNWMPSPRDSEIYPGLSSLVAWMTDQDIDIDLIPAIDAAAPLYDTLSVLSSDLENVLMTNWMVEAFDAQIKLSLWDAFQYGSGIFKSVWDNQLANGYGNAVLRRVDPWAFYVDPYATSLDDAEYMIEVRRMSWEEIERRFPETSSKVRDSSSDSIDEKPDLYNDVSRTGKANPGTIPQSGVWPGSSPGQPHDCSRSPFGENRCTRALPYPSETNRSPFDPIERRVGRLNGPPTRTMVLRLFGTLAV